MGVQSTAGGEGSPSLFAEEASGPKSVVNRKRIASSLEPDESVIYGLPGTGRLVWKKRIETERITGEELGLVVTDRRVLVVVCQQDGRQVIVLSYSDIESVSVTDGFFKTRLSIALQDGQEYSFEPATTESLTRIRGYVDVASECVDRVDAALGRAREASEELATHLRAGHTERADAAREQMRAAIGRAESELADAGVDPGRSEQIEAVRQECARGVVDARCERAEVLSEQALHRADSTGYTEAYRQYLDAREHLEVALALDIRYEFGEAESIQTAIETVDERIACLRTWPLALAKQTRERARGTERLETAVDAWHQTVEHYRDLLEAGWGTDLDFAGSRSNIRFQLACALNNLVESQRGLARQRTTEGDHHRTAGDTEAARTCYEAALDQLADATAIAREFRAGDQADIQTQRETVRTRLPSVGQSKTEPEV
jgi:hypothetical protein